MERSAKPPTMLNPVVSQNLWLKTRGTRAVQHSRLPAKLPVTPGSGSTAKRVPCGSVGEPPYNDLAGARDLSSFDHGLDQGAGGRVLSQSKRETRRAASEGIRQAAQQGRLRGRGPPLIAALHSTRCTHRAGPHQPPVLSPRPGGAAVGAVSRS